MINIASEVLLDPADVLATRSGNYGGHGGHGQGGDVESGSS